MKKTVTILMVLFVIICAVSCSNNDTTTLQEKSHIKLPDVSVFEPYYSEGLMWIEYKVTDTHEDNSRFGCVDKNGKLQFYIDNKEVCSVPTPFENGYSHIESKDSTVVSVLDKKGFICSSYNKLNITDIGSERSTKGDTSNCCVAYGYGYSVVQKHYSGFSDNYYEYIVFDPNGKKLYSFTTEDDEEIKVTHLGQGVFCFKNKGTFFCQGKKWTEYQTSNEFPSNAEMVYYNTEYGEDDNGNDTLEILFLTPKGEKISTGKLSREEYGWDSQATNVFNNIAVIYNYEYDNVFSYNVKEKTFKKLNDDTYYNQMSEDTEFILSGECIVANMKGEDDGKYYAVFNKNMDILVTPVKYTSQIDVYDNRIIVDFDSVYDLYDNFIFSFSENECEADAWCRLNDGVIFVPKENTNNDEKEYVLFDNNGKKVFESNEIDSLSAKEIIV